jgi:DeoR/GlpR family transcriptional regulator of sugar metabolism
MLPHARRAQIVDYLKSVKTATSESLSRMFGVTEETIRKDLNYLNDKGLVIRSFGGAMIKEEYDPSLAVRTVSSLEEKKAIARAALKLVGHGECIVLDAGSTTIELARLINSDSDNVIITNSLEILNILSKIEGISIISTGGTLRKRSMSFIGQITESSIGNFNISEAYISAKGISIQEGVMDTNEAEASVKRKMLDVAKRTTLLADSTKFSKLAYVTVCPIGKISRIITDPGIDPLIAEKYRAAGIEVVIADI